MIICDVSSVRSHPNDSDEDWIICLNLYNPLLDATYNLFVISEGTN